MRTRLIVGITGAGLAVAGMIAPLAAHHAFSAEFDANRPLQFEGSVVKVEWINPHVWIHIDVTNDDGTHDEWAFEAGTPNNLFRRGFTKQSLMPGQVIRVDGYQAKDGTNRGNGRDLTFPDGRTLFMGSSGTGAPYELVPAHVEEQTGQAGPGAGR